MGLGDDDRTLAAELIAAAMQHSRWRELNADEETAAATALFDLAAGRADLLAHAAGLLVGGGEGAPDEPRRRQAADLLLKAGADPDAIPRWIEAGRRHVQAARQRRRRPCGLTGRDAAGLALAQPEVTAVVP